MDAIFLLSILFFICGICLPLIHLLKKRKERAELAETFVERSIHEELALLTENWTKKGKIVHPVFWVNGGISSYQVKRLRKGVHPIRHTSNK